MINVVRLVCLLLVIGCARPTLAQKGVPQITIMQSGSDALVEDLSYLLGLTNETEQKQLPVVLEYLDVFLLGIDREKPIRADLLVEDQSLRTRLSFPVSDIGDFLDNVDGFGIDVRKSTASLYRLSNAFEGYLRYRRGYASISEEKDDVGLSLPDRRKGLEPLLEKQYDLAGLLENTPDDLDARREAFTAIRAELLAAVKPRDEESTEDFELRKLVTVHQLNELERMFVEARKLEIGWVTDAAAGLGRGELILEPIPETSLAATIEAVGRAPSRFASIKREDDAVLSLRLNHPLDEMRSKQLQEFFAVLRTRLLKRISETDWSDDQKAAGKQAADGFFDLLDANAAAGLLDLYSEIAKDADGMSRVAGGAVSADGAKLAEILKLLPAMRDTIEVESEIGTESGMALHKVVLPESLTNLQELLGEDRTVYVATSKDLVLYTAGPGALDRLKVQIALTQQELDKEAEPGPFFSLFARMHPWLKLRERLAGDEAAGDPELRNLALEALSGGDDVLEGRLEQKGLNVVGHMEVQPGILRLVGKLLARFSKETLDEQ